MSQVPKGDYFNEMSQVPKGDYFNQMSQVPQSSMGRTKITSLNLLDKQIGVALLDFDVCVGM